LEIETTTVFWSSSLVASRWPRASVPPNLMAKELLLRALIPVIARCHLTYNLQADVPLRRPFTSFDAGFPLRLAFLVFTRWSMHILAPTSILQLDSVTWLPLSSCTWACFCISPVYEVYHLFLMFISNTSKFHCHFICFLSSSLDSRIMLRINH
jgi:hypothetical protein